MSFTHILCGQGDRESDLQILTVCSFCSFRVADSLSGCSLQAADEDIQSYCGRNMDMQYKLFSQAKKQCHFVLFLVVELLF